MLAAWMIENPLLVTQLIYVGNNRISRGTQKQRMVARSSIEVKYCAIADITNELHWLCSLIRELSLPFSKPILWYDNLSAIYLTSIPIFHSR